MLIELVEAKFCSLPDITGIARIWHQPWEIQPLLVSMVRKCINATIDKFIVCLLLLDFTSEYTMSSSSLW